MATEPSRKAFIALLVSTATIAIATSSATTLIVLLLSEFDNTKFKNEDLKKGDKLLYHFILRPCLALPYYQYNFLPYFYKKLTKIRC